MENVPRACYPPGNNHQSLKLLFVSTIRIIYLLPLTVMTFSMHGQICKLLHSLIHIIAELIPTCKHVYCMCVCTSRTILSFLGAFFRPPAFRALLTARRGGADWSRAEIVILVRRAVAIVMRSSGARYICRRARGSAGG